LQSGEQDKIDSAITAYNNCLPFYDKNQYTEEYAEVHTGLADLYIKLQKISKDDDDLLQSIEYCKNALDIYSKGGFEDELQSVVLAYDTACTSYQEVLNSIKKF